MQPVLFGLDYVCSLFYFDWTMYAVCSIWTGLCMLSVLFGLDYVCSLFYLNGTMYAACSIWTGLCMQSVLFGLDYVCCLFYLDWTMYVVCPIWTRLCMQPVLLLMHLLMKCRRCAGPLCGSIPYLQGCDTFRMLVKS